MRLIYLTRTQCRAVWVRVFAINTHFSLHLLPRCGVSISLGREGNLTCCLCSISGFWGSADAYILMESIKIIAYSCIMDRNVNGHAYDLFLSTILLYLLPTYSSYPEYRLYYNNYPTNVVLPFGHIRNSTYSQIYRECTKNFIIVMKLKWTAERFWRS